MAKVTRNVTQEIKDGSGSGSGKYLKKATKKAPTSGMGYTATKTHRATGKKTTTTGKLTPTSAASFKSNGPRVVSASTPTTRTSPKAKTNRKIY